MIVLYDYMHIIHYTYTHRTRRCLVSLDLIARYITGVQNLKPENKLFKQISLKIGSKRLICMDFCGNIFFDVYTFVVHVSFNEKSSMSPRHPTLNSVAGGWTNSRSPTPEDLKVWNKVITEVWQRWPKPATFDPRTFSKDFVGKNMLGEIVAKKKLVWPEDGIKYPSVMWYTWKLTKRWLFFFGNSTDHRIVGMADVT